ncbi:MAG: glycerol-3-phosphate acyltransferase [Anaerolineales bacterium]|nr:glycerol-3-phosphate acyltransferase [Anaerolineales bacterium]
MTILLSIFVVVFGYLIGSIPTAYLAGRWIKKIDLREYGSGTISGSMVWEHVGKWPLFPVGIFDVLKGTFPTWLALYLGLDDVVAAMAGVAAVVGHNWPIYLKFTGGRGLSPMLGTWLVLWWPATLWMLIPIAIGWALGDSAPWALGTLLTLPIFSYFAGGPTVVTPTALAFTAITLVKRLEANRRPLPQPGPERRKVILRRLIFDRDIPHHRTWLDRTPDDDEG